jgi:glutamate/tyrosine decarboxylase-like PLP-dependent enzyme
METVLHTAWQSADLIRRSPHLELVREPELSIVLFRRNGWAASDYQDWSEDLLARQIGFVTPTTWEGAPVARLAFLHPGTTLAMVEDILVTMA